MTGGADGQEKRRPPPKSSAQHTGPGRRTGVGGVGIIKAAPAAQGMACSVVTHKVAWWHGVAWVANGRLWQQGTEAL